MLTEETWHNNLLLQRAETVFFKDEVNFLYNLEIKEEEKKPWQYMGCVWKKKCGLSYCSKE